MEKDVVIKVENLSKVFPLRQPKIGEDGVTTSEHWALKDVSFEIKKGESVGIIGPNGSGKSTLLKILAGVTKPTDGKVEIRGKIASILDIGAGFHPELSGKENVFLNGQIHGFSRKEIASKFDEIVAFSGIEKFIEEPVKNYSNGMYLRLAFSIMAHLDFDVYLMDEVLSVGDDEFRTKSQKRMVYLQQTMNKCIVTVSHNMWELVNADRIFYINEGQVDSTSKKEAAIKKYSANESLVNLFIDNPFFIEKGNYSAESRSIYTDKIKVYLTDNKGLEQKEFKSDEDITFVIDLFDIKKAVNVGFVIKDKFNHPVIDLSPLTSDILLEAGKNQKIYTQFEGRWFNAGIFTVDLVFFDKHQILYAEDAVASFKIDIEDAYKDTIYQYTWSAIRPFMKWKTQTISN